MASLFGGVNVSIIAVYLFYFDSVFLHLIVSSNKLMKLPGIYNSVENYP